MTTYELSKSKLLLAGLALAVIASSCAKPSGLAPQEDPSYFGAVANEAEFSFDAQLITLKSNGQPTDESLYKQSKEVAKYILGHMDKDGSIYFGYKTKLKKVESASETEFKITYTFSGKGLFKKQEIIDGGETKYEELKTYEFFVPLTPNKLYSVAAGKCHNLYASTDDSSYWYDWEPKIEGCPLVENVHYSKITADLKPIRSTKETYPEYKKLMVDDKLTVTMYFGAAEHHNKNWNPLDEENKDYGAAAYRQTRDFIIGLGFRARQFEENELREIYNPKDASKLPFAEDMMKIGDDGKSMRIRLLFLETQASEAERSEAFHYFLRHALKYDNVIMYGGHSGLGANLNVERIEKRHGFKIEFNPNYQIIHFGSCIPYAYYADMYLSRKVTSKDAIGSKSLDVLAYARESYFQAKEDQRVLAALDKYVFTGEKTSYQDMITSHPSDLYGVVGDEDND